ncbi:DUF4301 family protein [Ancylomarina euxinus]|uniref:DUF4301 family protein n=1 Tax=Ancylomarina euxinus TaxID=2283627 RepID=A0A425XX86_9BACT|nr:DUF4301 family protein [Ancylomarina euxinus]MCZ4696138.1 DUF4301 family protein [Ancylomarina euxinus]MUP16547.1 DUF4301 family protein [Ancylomarina euxinus]RRG19254.1 DUF4301 family protein [Ancylomarina euxinus]
MFSKKDLSLIKKRGMDKTTIEEQLKHFETGFPKVNLVNPAIINDGIMRIEDEEIKVFRDNYINRPKKLSVIKFVPASGAATRMFQKLYDFIKNYQETEEDYLAYMKDKSPEGMFKFFENIEDFAFFVDLRAALQKKGMDIEKLLEKNNFKEILNTLLYANGLNYSNKPKGLLRFHKYQDYSRTAFEEHWAEALHYAKNYKGTAQLHLTISEEHKKLFARKLKKSKSAFENKYDGKLKVTFSYQKASTDTIAVDMENKPFKDVDESILFRPGGHGALIENLNELKADLVFIKNIDNVVPDRIKEATYKYKEALAGVLLKYQAQMFDYIAELDNPKLDLSVEKLNEMLSFSVEQLCIKTPKTLKTDNPDKLRAYLLKKLNRPIRVCGMVMNEGEPGGGPFWVKNSDNCSSLHIIESSQIDHEDKKQAKILAASTHFNPVDLVCGIKDYKGKKFDLTQFVDHETGFISKKAHNGTPLKAMELPGLWNGAMADWNTIFVEVPTITFNPVKTIFDLLRVEHRN